MRRAAVLLAIALTAAGTGSCREPLRAVRVAVHSAPQSFDPHLQDEVLTSAVLANLYDGLTEFDREARIGPALATDWKNPDELTWLFRLREGVRFHDGRPLQAADVVFSFERARHHSGSGMTSYLVEVESVRAVDPGSVEVRTRRPFAALLAKLSTIAIVPRDAPETITRPVGTGSYRLGSKGESGFSLVPAPAGWRKGRAVLPLEFVIEGNPERRIDRLLAGELDVATDLPEWAVAKLRGARCCSGVTVPSATVEYLRLSTREAPFRDRRVRRAVDLAIDRAAYIEVAHHGLGLALGQLVVPGVFGYAPELKATTRDLPEARRLLSEAGYPDGFDVALEFREGRRGDVLAKQLGEAGIRVTPRQMRWTELHPRLRRGEAGFYLGGVVATTGEASDVLDGSVHTRDESRGYGGTNHSRYSNPGVDALIEAAAATSGMTERRALLQKAMRLAMEDLHIVPLAGLYEVAGVRRGVRFLPRVDKKILGREIGLE